jgi:enamine deaminase RidA (YjgF/YER057c/UK114 family)
MKIERHDIGPRMSKVVVHGDTVYLAGIVADNPKGKSVSEQTRDIVAQIDGFLAKAGTDKTKLLSANIWITDMANFAEMNAVWDGWVAPGHTPARATVEAKLAAAYYKVEIMVVAGK